MPAKVTVSFIYQYYESDAAVFNFLIDDILKCENHTDVKYFIHKYEVKNQIIKNIRFENQPGGASQFTEKTYNVPDYHFDLLLAKNKWVDFFTKYAKAENAAFNIVFTVQHSNGFGIKNKDTSYTLRDDLFAKQVNITEDAITRYHTNIFQQINTGGDYYRLIPYFVLADAIAEGFAHKKINLLFLNNCFSQTLEAGLAFNKCVGHLGTSQATIPGLGPNYKELFAYLDESVKPDNQTDINVIANNLMTNFKSKFSEKRILDFLRTIECNQNKPDSELSGLANLHCLSINNLEKYPDILQSLNALAIGLGNDVLSKAVCKVRENENNIRCRDASLDTINELSLIDMYNLFEELSKQSQGITLPDGFLQQIKDVVIADCPSDIFFNPPPGQEYYKILPHGISFFLPHSTQYNGNNNTRQYSTGQLILNLINKNINVIGISNTEWASFLKHYMSVILS